LPAFARRCGTLDAHAWREGVKSRTNKAIYCICIAFGSVAARVRILEVAEYLAGRERLARIRVRAEPVGNLADHPWDTGLP